jgi:UDP-N-acetylmuramoylalanine--D-glutamate ligase
VRVVVYYGLGKSGEAAATRLRERGDEVVLVDRSLGNEHDLSLLDGAGLLVKSPGSPPDAPIVRAARERGVPVWSEVELGYTLLPGSRFVGVTGTNGKTTTTALLGEIFRAAGLDVAVAGNIGVPLTSIRAADWVVCELSSFQLEDVHEFACDVAVLLNVEPDHLDRYPSFEAYRDAKLRIFERARAKVVPRGSGLAGIEFSSDDPLPAEPLLRGAHNRENAAAATAAARAAGIADDAIAQALATFAGVPHRLELVGEVAGVRFVNDSKATNVAAARKGLEAYSSEPVHLILGGSLKGEDFAPLAAAIGDNVRSIHLIGRASDELAAALGAHEHWRDETLDQAVAHAARLAAPGDVVLLSPACASYDQFEDFEDRGDEFRRLVTTLSF